FNCPHTGVALACLEKLVARGVIQRDADVIVISTAHGLKFTEFKAGYHEERLSFASRYANKPVAMSGDPEQAVGELHRLLDGLE
ncbi:MAG: threonine synthase, partial [Myxococcales bacterium]|nr:threonine synthase [Myxococcales bacterium]